MATEAMPLSEPVLLCHVIHGCDNTRFLCALARKRTLGTFNAQVAKVERTRGVVDVSLPK
jgi:hypothetical protein